MSVKPFYGFDVPILITSHCHLTLITLLFASSCSVK